jgi:putative ATP-binding cassette transporter
MEFFKFLRNEHDDFGTKALVISAAAGVINGILAIIIINAAQHAEAHKLNLRYMLMLAVALAAFWYCKRLSLNRTTYIVEQVLERVRMRIADKIRKTDLQSFETIGRARLFSSLNTDTQTLSQFTPFIINASSSCIMVLFALISVFFISKTAFFIVVCVTALSLLYWFSSNKKINQELVQASRMQEDYYVALEELLDGFKELKVSTSKSNDFYHERLGKLSQEMESLKIKTGLSFNHINLFAQSFSFFLLAAIVFLIPVINSESTTTIPQIAAILLFVIGPLGEIAGNASLLAKCNVAVSNIKNVEKELDNLEGREQELFEFYDSKTTPKEINFDSLRIENLAFTYPTRQGDKGFNLGPLDLSISKGEVIFLIGGNGSGKSTLLKLLTGLYTTEHGNIFINNKTLTANNLIAYRNLFSIIFTDFHLFKNLYGVQETDQEYIDNLLDMMQLNERSKIIDNQIMDTNLSTGQRKRMALIASILEQKQLYVFDEWAADQDPEFRRYFYTEILPLMKSQGKTVIAATHDDQYFDYADRVVRLNEGRLELYHSDDKH